MAKIDWIQAQKDYLQDTTMSYANIAIKYGVALNTVKKRGAVEGWLYMRQNIANKSIIKVESRLIDQNIAINEKHVRHYRNMQATASNMLIIANNTLQQKIKEKGIENITISEPGIISPSLLKALVDAMKVAIDGERVAVGLPTTVERKDINVRGEHDLFAKLDTDKLYKLMGDTVSALADKAA